MDWAVGLGGERDAEQIIGSAGLQLRGHHPVVVFELQVVPINLALGHSDAGDVDFRRATPPSAGARALDSARLTVCWVSVSSSPAGRLAGVVTHGPAPI